MTAYKLTIEYDGAPFSGWQTQPNRRTVQSSIEAALATILRRPVRLQGAGRTDAGVHARGQVASLETDVDMDPQRLAKGVTALCRPDISVIQAEVMPTGFNARFDAKAKHYRYAILNRRAPSPLLGRTTYHVPWPLDIDAMASVSRRLVGERDFRGFRAADCGRENTVRRLTEVALSAHGPVLQVDVRGEAFLKNMVRIIAGTLVDVGLGRRGEDDVRKALETGDRGKAGHTAPAHGLTLMEVLY